MSSRLLLVLLVPLAILAYLPAASASVPVGVCTQVGGGWCPGWVCAYVEAKYTCVNPTVSTSVCTEFTHNCPYKQLVCAAGKCVEDPCYNDPELCHPMLA